MEDGVRISVWVFPDHPVAEMVKAAKVAEDAGMDTFWLGDEGVAREPFTVMTAIGRDTTSIELGLAVSNPYLRHPALTASTAATVAEATGRRLHLGFGPGGAASLNPVGLERVAPVASLRTALRTSRAVLDARSAPGFTPGPFARPESRVDLWIGARGPAITSMAGEEADGFFANLIKPRLGAALDLVRAAGSIDVAMCFPLIADESTLEDVRPYVVLGLLDAPAGTPEAAGMSRTDAEAAAAALAADDIAKAASLVSDEVIGNFAICGTPADASSEFAQLALEHGVTEITAAVFGDDLPLAVEVAAGVLSSARAVIEGAA